MAIIEHIENELFSLSHSIDKTPKDTDFPPHIHDVYELFCLVKGEVNYSVEGHFYNLHSGAIMLIRSSENHKLLVNKSSEYERYVLNFSPSLLSGFSKELLNPFRQRELGEKNMYLPSEFEHVVPLFYFEKMFSESKYAPSRDVVLASLCALLCEINVAFCKKDELALGDSSIEKKIISYVNENLTNDINTSDVAEYVHLSPSQVSRIFKRATGTSIHDYIITKRLILFNKKLSKGISIVQASRECGFSDYSAFYRLYKKRFGFSPSKKHLV